MVWVMCDSLTVVGKFINTVKVVDLLDPVTRSMLERMELDVQRRQAG